MKEKREQNSGKYIEFKVKGEITEKLLEQVRSVQEGGTKIISDDNGITSISFFRFSEAEDDTPELTEKMKKVGFVVLPKDEITQKP